MNLRTRKGIITIILSLAILVSPLNLSEAITVKDIKVIQDMCIPSDDFIGSICLAEANLYEDDFDSKYLFPMQGMCTTSDGKIAVIDNAYGRVHILNPLLQNTFVFGSLQQLIYPTDIAFYSNNFYISDALSGDIKVFSVSGLMERSIGKGFLNTPTGVTVLGGYIFVADYLANKLYKFDRNGTIIQSFNIEFPGGLATDGKDKIAAIDMRNNSIFVLDINFKPLLTISGRELIFPSDLTFDASGNLFVADRGLSRGNQGNGRVLQYSKEGKFIKEIGKPSTIFPGQADGSFITPTGISTDNLGNIYVYDSGFYYWDSDSEAPFGFPIGARISVFNSIGMFLSKKDFSHAKTSGVLLNPLSSTLDEKGNVWVLNLGGFETSEIVELSPSGQFVKRINTIQGGAFPQSYSIFADKKGNLFVGMNGAIGMFTSSGDFKKIIRSSAIGIVRKIIKGKDGFIYATMQDRDSVIKIDESGVIQTVFPVCSNPAGIAQDKDGKFYITSISENKVYIYSSKFSLLKTFGESGRGPLGMYIPEDIAIDSYGNIVICDTENGRISFFSEEGVPLYQSQRIFYEACSIEIEDDTFLITDCFHNIVRIVKEVVEEEPYSFVIYIEPDTSVMSPGDEEIATVSVKNIGTNTDAYTINLKQYLNPGWEASIVNPPLRTFTLNPGETFYFKIALKSSVSAKEGEKGSCSIEITSESSGVKKAVSLNVTISTKLPLNLFSEDLSVQENETMKIPIFVKNAANIRAVAFEVIYNKDNLKFLDVDTPIEKDLVIYKENENGLTIAFSSPKGKEINGRTLILQLIFKSVKASTNQILFKNVEAYNVVNISVEVQSSPLLISIKPYLWVNFPDRVTATSQNFTFSGKTTPGYTVTVNENKVQVKSDGGFTAFVPMLAKENIITITSLAPSGEKTVIKRTVLFEGKREIKIILEINNPIMEVNEVKMEIDPGRGTVPIIMQQWNRTIVPIRTIVEILGGNITWLEKERLVQIEFKEKEIKLWIDQGIAEVNGNKMPIDPENRLVKPVIINSRTYVPVRFVAENLGCTVFWDNATRKVTIIYKE